MKRFGITFPANVKLQFVPLDQISLYYNNIYQLTVHYIHKSVTSNLTFAVNLIVNLSNGATWKRLVFPFKCPYFTGSLFVVRRRQVNYEVFLNKTKLFFIMFSFLRAHFWVMWNLPGVWATNSDKSGKNLPDWKGFLGKGPRMEVTWVRSHTKV